MGFLCGLSDDLGITKQSGPSFKAMLIEYFLNLFKILSKTKIKSNEIVLNIRCPTQAHAFEHMVSSWWFFFREVRTFRR
jgi:phage regulator Rha-like protein